MNYNCWGERELIEELERQDSIIKNLLIQLWETLESSESKGNEQDFIKHIEYIGLSKEELEEKYHFQFKGDEN